MKHEQDPKKVLLDQIGDLKGIDVHFNQVVVAIYVRPKTTAHGVYLPDQYRDEDKFQGKVGLVVKKGPLAFVPTDKNDDPHGFQHINVEVGDWVLFRPSDGWSVSINKTDCRILIDTSVKCKVSHPDMIW
jgi:co-chaperonin GroES (HSP10)